METQVLIKGALDVLVLKALMWQPMHGFEITAWIEERAQRALEIDDSALYQALYRLEARGLVQAAWGVTENNRRARYYTIRPSGRAHLKTETDACLAFAESLTLVLTSAPRRP